jgi:hypothetical protein
VAFKQEQVNSGVSARKKLNFCAFDTECIGYYERIVGGIVFICLSSSFHGLGG